MAAMRTKFTSDQSAEQEVYPASFHPQITRTISMPLNAATSLYLNRFAKYQVTNLPNNS
jgi:hypothetical protein